MTVCRCFNGSCPEPVTELTINQTTVTIGGAGLTITVGATTPAADNKKLITITVDQEAQFAVRMWFVDNGTLPDTQSTVPPTDPGVVEFTKVSDALGEIEFEVENTVAGTHTWYLVATLGSGVVVSEAITLTV